VVGDFEIDEDFGDDSDDTATGGKGGFCDSLHEADIRSTVDKPYVALGDSAAELKGSFAVDRVGAVG
jgi:hypothetical protein